MSAVRIIALLLIASLLGACSSGDDVPDDQVIKPGAAPSGWERADLGIVSVAVPSTWEKDDTTSATETMDVTTWRLPNDDGTASSGLEVRVISKPQQPAEDAAQALAVSAMAQLQGGKVDPKAITWPQAADAYYLAYDATFGPTDKKDTYVTRTLVLDLEGGQQVQVTSLAPDSSSDAKLPERVLGTVELKAPDSSSGGY